MDNSIIESLEKLLLSEDFIALTSKTTKLNVFNVLKLENKELRHSNFLAWLLNPNESHNLGDAFLKELLQIILKDYLKNPDITTRLFDIILNDFNDAQIEREKRIDKGKLIDIFIESKRNSLVCVIENKVWSGEMGNQLENYQAYIDSKYKDYQHKLFIFLTPHTSDKLHKNYMCLDYGKVYQAIDNLLNRQAYMMCDKIRYFIEDYKEMVKRHIMGNIDKEILDLCLKIYDKNKEAIDTINKVVEKHNLKRVYKISQEVIKEDSPTLDLEEWEDDNYRSVRYVRFVSKKADYDSLKIAKRDVIESERILMIEFVISQENIRADIIIRNPKDDSVAKQRKEELLKLAKEEFKYRKKAKEEGYSHIYLKPLFDSQDYVSLYSSDSELKEILKKKLYESEIIKIYEEFADKANKLITNIS